MSDFWCPLANNVIEGVAVLDGITQQEAFSLQERERGHLITTQLELLSNLNAITKKLNKRYMPRKVWYNNKHTNELIRHVPILKQAIRIIMVLGIPIQFLLITKLQGIFVIAVITIERVTNCIKTYT